MPNSGKFAYQIKNSVEEFDVDVSLYGSYML